MPSPQHTRRIVAALRRDYPTPNSQAVLLSERTGLSRATCRSIIDGEPISLASARKALPALREMVPGIELVHLIAEVQP